MVQDIQTDPTHSDLAFFDHIAGGICLVDSTGTVYFANSALAQILALPTSAMVGKKADYLFGFEQKINQSSSDLGLSRAGITERGFPLATAQDVTYMTASGVYREMNISIAPYTLPLPPQPGLPVPVPPFGVIVVRDMTAQRQHERVKTDFVDAAAHQLRTPLTSLKMSLGLLAQSMDRTTNVLQERLVKNAEISVGRMERLTNALIELTNIQSGRVRLQPTPVSVHYIVTQGVQSQRDRLDKKQQQLYEELPAEALSVQADAQSISRVLGHLIANASKFSAPGTPIVVRIVKDGQSIVISVHDEGIGIPADEQTVIFETFYQSQVVENATEAGSGLGLPLVRALVELNGGQIWCESIPGEGSTFSVRLPAAAIADGEGHLDEQGIVKRQGTYEVTGIRTG